MSARHYQSDINLDYNFGTPSSDPFSGIEDFDDDIIENLLSLPVTNHAREQSDFTNSVAAGEPSLFVSDDDDDDDDNNTDDSIFEEIGDDLFEQLVAVDDTSSHPHPAGRIPDSSVTSQARPSAGAPGVGRRPPTAPLRGSTTQQTNTTAATWPSQHFSDQEADSLEATSTSFSSNMPLTTRRGSHASTDRSPPNKRSRVETTRRRTPPRTDQAPAPVKVDYDEDDLFGSPPPPGRPQEAEVDDLATIDLTSATEAPKDFTQPEVDNRIKLGAFQCVICMDDVTSLTVTHCGHLYCAECLHSSLHTGATKGRCPMCRQKLDIKPRSNYTNKTKGHWALELKFMTATRKGKRKADTLE